MPRRLTILNVAFPFAPVRADTAGGAEQVLWQIDRALVAAGHRSLVLAQEGSEVAGELIATPAVTGLIDERLRAGLHAAYRERIGEAVTRVDLIHLHGLDFAEYLPAAGVPVLVTLHLPPSWYGAGVFRLARPETYLHCVSASQMAECPASPTMLPVIENGVPETLFAPDIKPRSYCAAVGRICPEKGTHLALNAARLADACLLVAGEAFGYPEHLDYFKREVKPRLDARRRWIGRVGLHRKRRLLAGAQCLLLPTLAPETSSLVAMEALMCGTPVIAFRSGALPTIVEEGVTGFLVEDVAQMADAIPLITQLDRRVCRETAMRRFSLRRSMAKYLDLYQELTRA